MSLNLNFNMLPMCYWVTVFITFLYRPVSASDSKYSNNSLSCGPNKDFKSKVGLHIEPSLEKYEAALLMLLGFGGFSVFLAVLYNIIRKYVYHDVNNVDSTFDAGGDVSWSLTAVTIAAQLLWPADLMQCVTFAVKYGIAGAFWYCGAAMINLSLFPLLSFKFKSRAPGAKTFLQIIYARFGWPTHMIFTFFSLLVNFIVISTILVGGIAVMQATIKDMSPALCLIIIVTLCGSYSLIGGLGSTFYVSYFNALVTFVVLIVLIIKIIYSSEEPFGSLEKIYERVNCVSHVDGNMGGSRFTFLSEPALMVCIQSVFLVASITYCDQASWQSRIAAKPLQGAIGFLFGSFVWFSVPASMGLVTALTYVAETAHNASTALSLEQIDSGITSTYMAQRALGTGGVIMMLTMITMLTMSTGSGEIMGVSAIAVYDIYQTYINPYRKKFHHRQCILCGETKRSNKEAVVITSDNGDASDGMCKCPPALTCRDCKKDIENMSNASQYPGGIVIYRCVHHSHFRQYQDSLINFKNWCMMWISISLIPFGLVLFRVGIDLNWLMSCGSIMVVPSFPGVILSVTWVKATSRGLITGSVTGFICGLTTNILVASLHFEMAGGFFVATSQPYSVVGGSAVAGLVSLVLTVAISIGTHDIETTEDEDAVWEKLRNLDNPLHPWGAEFVNDFTDYAEGTTRPTQEQLETLGRAGKLVSIGGTICFLVIFIVIIPGSMSSLQVLSEGEFKSWTMFITSWLIIAAVVIIVVTPTEEIFHIVKTLRNRKSKAKDEGLLGSSDNKVTELENPNGCSSNIELKEYNQKDGLL